MNPRRKILMTGAIAVIAAGAVSAQFIQRDGGRGPWNANESSSPRYIRIEQGGTVDENSVRTARETASHSTGTPEWTNPAGFEKDVFTFARVIFPGVLDASDIWNYQGRLGWWVDYPDADLNFSYRLQQLTSMRVDPDCRVLKLTDPTLADFPLIYMTHVEHIRLPDDQLNILRNYLLNGGVLFVNDFWNSRSWRGFETEMKRVLPNHGWTELRTDHPIFHTVFDLKGTMQDWRIPTLQFWNRDHDPRNPNSSLSLRDRGPDSEEMHVRAWFDDKGRLMVIAIHNSDVSDGWEREGENDEYFHTFAEKIAYPLGINIIVYAMTH